MTTRRIDIQDYAIPVAIVGAGMASLAIAALAAPCVLLGAAHLAARLRDPDAGVPIAPAPLRERDADGPGGSPASGIFCLGTERDTKRQVWLSNADMVRHFAFMGSSGSGKADVMHALEANVLARGSGFLHVDVNGDIATFAKVAALATRMGRVDDLLLVDFGGGAGVPGNTFNPLASGDARTLATLVADALVEESDDGRFTKVACEPLLAPLAALVHLRDEHGEGLTLATLADALDLDALVRLRDDPRLSPPERADLADMLSAMPGWDGNAPTDGTRASHERLLGGVRDRLRSLADAYPGILGPHRADVDMHDVVARRRLLVVTLPSLWRTRARDAVLARLMAASLKAAVTTIAARERRRDPADVRPAASPFLAVLDNAGLYAVPGMDALARDATLANVSLVYGVGMGHGDRMMSADVGAPLAGVGAVALMRIEDALTLDRGMGVAARLAPSDILGLTDASPARGLPARPDIQAQKEGEMHLCIDGRCIRMVSMFVDTRRLVDARDLVVAPVSTLDVGGAATRATGATH